MVILHIHKDLTDSLDLTDIAIAHAFSMATESRQRYFGKFKTISKYFGNCSVANVHVTRVLSVDWMVQPNHGQQAIFKNSVLTQAIHLYRNSQMDRLTGNYDVIYRACTMTDREGQRD